VSEMTVLLKEELTSLKLTKKFWLHFGFLYC